MFNKCLQKKESSDFMISTFDKISGPAELGAQVGFEFLT